FANRSGASATVTHPFHPLRGRTFEVLKVRRLSGQEMLSLRHPNLGSIAMPRDWTDWAPPGAQPPPERVKIYRFSALIVQDIVDHLPSYLLDTVSMVHRNRKIFTL